MENSLIVRDPGYGTRIPTAPQYWKTKLSLPPHLGIPEDLPSHNNPPSDKLADRLLRREHVPALREETYLLCGQRWDNEGASIRLV